jgi:hypothetical protein
MSIEVNFIRGKSTSACVNNAFSIVRNETNLLDIIPTRNLPKDTTFGTIKSAFEAAIQNNPNAKDATIIKEARKTLQFTP